MQVTRKWKCVGGEEVGARVLSLCHGGHSSIVTTAASFMGDGNLTASVIIMQKNPLKTPPPKKPTPHSHKFKKACRI